MKAYRNVVLRCGVLPRGSRLAWRYLAVLDAEVDAIWQAPPTLDRIQSFITSLK